MAKKNKVKSKSKSIRQTRIVTEICICTVAVVSVAYVLKVTYDRTDDVPESPFIATSVDDESINSTLDDPNKIIYESLGYPTTKKFEGDLILVNNNTEYFGFNEELVTVTYKIEDEERVGFSGGDDSVQVRPVFYTALADMLEDFYKATDIDDVVILDGYRTSTEQQQLYDDDLAETGLETSERVAKPGYSEHQTGYAVDLTTSSTWDYDGEGDYSWINENCWKYGIILRYPEDKSDITDIQYEPWHYRYVGVPHAYYMSQHDMTLEEYINFIKGFTYVSGSSEFEYALEIEYDNTKCEVYYVPSDDGSDLTYIPVPSGENYEISGNNSDGFIVTVYLESDEQPVTEAQTYTNTETETETTNYDE